MQGSSQPVSHKGPRINQAPAHLEEARDIYADRANMQVERVEIHHVGEEGSSVHDICEESNFSIYEGQ